VVEKGCNYNRPFTEGRIVAHVCVVARNGLQSRSGTQHQRLGAKSSIPRKTIELQTIRRDNDQFQGIDVKMDD
jgi:hypothetical protein